jgi:hypothetical protein
MDLIQEQLDKVINEFNANSNARKEVYMKRKELDNLIRDHDNKSKELSKLIQELKDAKEFENIFSSFESVEGFNLLSDEERSLIVKGMDKTDYTNNDPLLPRWHDLERLIKEVGEFKIKYPGWVLSSLKKLGQIDTIPPQNFYKFTYLSPQGHYFTYGGIELIDI